MKYGKLLKFVISACILAFLLLQMDWQILLERNNYSNGWLIAFSTLFILGQIFFLNLRWHAYLNLERNIIPFRTSVLINLAGYFSNVLFIASIGGIVVKSGLAIRYGVSIVHALFATFLDRFMTLVALIVLSAIGLILLQDVLDHKILMMLSLSIFGVILCIVVAVLSMRLGVFKEFILASRKRSKVVAVMRDFMENYQLMSSTFVYSILAQICFVISVYILSLSFSHVPHSTLSLFAIIPILALISSLPISFGGWGIREGAFVYGLGLLGYSTEQAFIISIQVGIVTLIAPLLVGSVYIVKKDFIKILQFKSQDG